jgi:DNA polymerase-4
VGPKTATKLRAAGITQLVDVRRVEEEQLRRVVGSMAGWLRQLAEGQDDRRVEPHRESKSSGAERTYPEDLVDLDTIRAEVVRMAERAAGWLAREACEARTVTLKVRYHDFTTITRRHSEAPTREAARISARALDLLTRTDAGRRPVRLIGVSVQGFVGDGAPDPPRTDAGRLPFDPE